MERQILPKWHRNGKSLTLRGLFAGRDAGNRYFGVVIIASLVVLNSDSLLRIVVFILKKFELFFHAHKKVKTIAHDKTKHYFSTFSS